MSPRMVACPLSDADVTWQVAAALMDVQTFAVPPLLELLDVTYRRDGSEIIHGVGFTVRAGEHWAMLGPNGAGKSTLLGFCGAGTLPTSGTVGVRARDGPRNPASPAPLAAAGPRHRTHRPHRHHRDSVALAADGRRGGPG